MTKDTDILAALRFDPMTASEIGRGFAPENIKDREGWGRKWVVRNGALLIGHGKGWTARDVLEPTYNGPDFTVSPPAAGFLNRATELLHSWLTDAELFFGHDSDRYKAPHAPRGTPPRPHHPRRTRRIRFCNV